MPNAVNVSKADGPKKGGFMRKAAYILDLSQSDQAYVVCSSTM